MQFYDIFNKKDIEYLTNQILKKRNISLHPYDVGVLLYKYGNEAEVLANAESVTFDGKMDAWYNGSNPIYDIDRFREPIIRKTQTGKYTEATPPINMYSPYAKDSEYYKFWNEEARRCLYGYHVGDNWITGYHYFYLNYSRIEVITSRQLGDKVIYDRKGRYPDFWDGDFYFFHYIEEAKRQGKHGICLKRRGVGMSWKLAAIAVRNYSLIPENRTIIYAGNETYLIGKDGTLDKTWYILNYVNEHTAWAKKAQVSNTKLGKRASYKMKTPEGQEIERGFMSEIMGATMGNDVHKSRGKRAYFIGFEEFGSQDNGDTLWEITTPSVEQGQGDRREVYGTRLAFGTGGEEGASFKAMRQMIYKPKNYDILDTANRWDNGSYGERVGYFWPVTVNMAGYMDKDGNSDIKGATAAVQALHQRWIDDGLEGAILAKRKAENPLTIQDAILDTEGSPFPVADLRQRRAMIETTSNLRGAGVVGHLVYTARNEVEFIPDTARVLLPIRTAEDATNSTEGAVIVYKQPIITNNEAAIAGRYVIGIDPIDFDKNEVGKDFSFGVAVVMDMLTEEIVAIFATRPENVEDLYETTRRLALYYNCKIMHENNLRGLKTYLQKHNSIGLLALTPKHLEVSYGFKSKTNRKYGVTGSERLNKHLRERITVWLLKEHTIDDEGNIERNLDRIVDVGILDQLINWTPKGNFDWVSALMMAIVAYDEFDIKETSNKLRPPNGVLQAEFWTKKISGSNTRVGHYFGSDRYS